MLEELLLILAGLPTSLSSEDLSHPAEAQILEIASVFGRRHLLLKEACENRDDPISVTIDSEVCDAFMEALCILEIEVLSGKVHIIRILAETVQKWERRFEFGTQVMQIPLKNAALVLRDYRDQYSGFEDVLQVNNACIEAIDSVWKDDIANLLLWGQGQTDAAILMSHPCISDCKPIINDIYGCSSQIMNSRRLVDDERTLELFEVNHARIKKLPVPLNPESIIDAFSDIRRDILSFVFKTETIEDLFFVLRRIVLLGSSSWVECLCASDANPRETLEVFREDFQEIPESAMVLATKCLRWDGEDVFTDLVLGPSGRGLAISLEWPLNMVVDSRQCRIYCHIHGALMSLSIVRALLSSRTGWPDFVYRIFLNVLWGWIQSRFEWYFDKLRMSLASDPTQGGGIHTETLTQLAADSCLGDKDLRMALYDLLKGAMGSEQSAMQGFKNTLSSNPRFDSLVPQLP